MEFASFANFGWQFLCNIHGCVTCTSYRTIYQTHYTFLCIHSLTTTFLKEPLEIKKFYYSIWWNLTASSNRVVSRSTFSYLTQFNFAVNPHVKAENQPNKKPHQKTETKHNHPLDCKMDIQPMDMPPRSKLFYWQISN